MMFAKGRGRIPDNSDRQYFYYPPPPPQPPSPPPTPFVQPMDDLDRESYYYPPPPPQPTPFVLPMVPRGRGRIPPMTMEEERIMQERILGRAVGGMARNPPGYPRGNLPPGSAPVRQSDFDEDEDSTDTDYEDVDEYGYYCPRGLGGGSETNAGEFRSTVSEDDPAILGYASAQNEIPSIMKNFYNEAPEVTNMSDDEAKALRLSNDNTLVMDTKWGRTTPKPIKTFGQAFNDFPEILEQIEHQNFQQPTPIQCQMWPSVLSGFDTIGIAQTGTGKTLAYLLPILIHLGNQPEKRNDGPWAVIMVPTRELALQIHDEVKKYRYKWLTSHCIFGGGNKHRADQIREFENAVDILIATPGRLNDFVQEGIVNLSAVTFVVLDEADRLLELEFEKDIRAILNEIRDDRQTVLTSATWSEGVRNLVNSYTTEPFLVSVGGLELSAVHTVKQEVIVMGCNQKDSFLLKFLEKMRANEKVIIFAGSRKTAGQLERLLTEHGLKCARIHGKMDQVYRENALKMLKMGRLRFLIATDVASRGLDISDVTHVLNYDFPRTIEEYVHRVGRTGRAGKDGVSVSIMTLNDKHHSTKLISILQEAKQDIPHGLKTLSELYEKAGASASAQAMNPQPEMRWRQDQRDNRPPYMDPRSYYDPYTGDQF